MGDLIPAEWKGDERVNVLVAPFRSRYINPINYDNKLTAWHQIICNYCTHNKCALISISKLSAVFSQWGKTPYCLEFVFKDMVTSGKLVSFTKFNQRSHVSWTNWAASTISIVPLWVFNKFNGHSDNTQIRNDDLFVVLEILKTESEKVLNFFLNDNKNQCVLSNKLFTFDEILNNQNELNLTKDGIDLVLKNLIVQQQVVSSVVYLANEDKVKELTVFKFSHDAVTKSDKSIFTLNYYEKMIEKSVEELEKEILEIELDVRQYLKEGKKSLAKSYLLKKKRIMGKILQRTNMLNNINQAKNNLDDMTINVKIVDALRISKVATQDIINDTGVNINMVDKILDDLREVMENQEVITNSLSSPVIPNEYDDSSIEEEIKKLSFIDENQNIELKINNVNVVDEHEILHSEKEIVSNPVMLPAI